MLEDHDQARFVICAFLESKGYNVPEAKAISLCARG
jgi:hypothetical protein